MRLFPRLLLIAALVVAITPLAAQAPATESMAGVKNFARVETTIACAGAIDAAVAVPEIKKLGFVSIINLREATEPGADVENEREIAESAGLKYFHVPFNGSNPDPKAADAFVVAITAAGAEPAFVHCSGGNRAATMWLIKRLVVDHWAADRAVKEAIDLGQTSAPLRTFALDYAARHKP